MTFHKAHKIGDCFTCVFFAYSGRGKDGSMGSLYGKFSLIDLAGMCKAIIVCYIIGCSIGNC